MHQLPELPYALDALEPHISRETLAFHHGKHHQAYIDKLNQQVAETDRAKASLVELIRDGSGALFNNAAQAWNHEFYWHCLSPEGGGEPEADLGALLEKGFGSLAEFKTEFTSQAVGLFGSGWAWLVQRPDGSLAVTQSYNADNPLTGDDTPLLTCDVWEHAYYIDYRNRRPDYLQAFWNLINWRAVAERLAQA